MTRTVWMLLATLVLALLGPGCAVSSNSCTICDHFKAYDSYTAAGKNMLFRQEGDLIISAYLSGGWATKQGRRAGAHADRAYRNYRRTAPNTAEWEDAATKFMSLREFARDLEIKVLIRMRDRWDEKLAEAKREYESIRRISEKDSDTSISSLEQPHPSKLRMLHIQEAVATIDQLLARVRDLPTRYDPFALESETYYPI